MNNLLLRAITGAVFVSLILCSIWIHPFFATGVFTLFLFLGLIEFFKLFRNQVQVSWLLYTFAGLLVFASMIALNFNPEFILCILFSVPILFLTMLTELWRKKDNPLLNIGVLFTSVFYIVIPFALMVRMSFMQNASTPLLIGMFILIWSNDTFAYLSGRLLGKTPLFHRISPNKTWEGTIGGIVLTAAAALLVGRYLDQTHSYLFWIGAALIIAPCAIFGDLLESLFKRSLNIKDSGNILPGHGGILDRFDAALFATPFFYCFWLIYVYF